MFRRELGSWRFASQERAPRTEVWWALGSSGLQELQDTRGSRNEGGQHYGYRLGTFLRELALMFQPRSIVLSGGIVHDYWDHIAGGIDECLRAGLRDDLQPSLIRSPYPETALIGAKVVLENPSMLR